jgi:hypothetical protein
VKFSNRRHDPDKTKETKRDPPRFIIDEVIADGSFLQILPKKES